MASITETQVAMMQLLEDDNKPNIKLAFWNSALSCRIRLDKNGKLARIMASYVDKPLPDRETLYQELKVTGANIWRSHIDALYAIERLYNQGLLYFPTLGTLEEQKQWRRDMVGLIPGLACKLISWAFFIYSPLDCKLLTLDCWHCKRLGVEQGKLSGSTARAIDYYEQIETLLMGECIGLYPDHLPQIVAAMLWLNYRNEGVTSHREISCRWY